MSADLGPGVAAAFTTRAGGRSRAPFATLNLALHVDDDPTAVLANRQHTARALGVDPARVTWAEQVHGARAADVARDDVGRGAASGHDAMPGCDALVTAEPMAPLAVLAADCVPLLLADPGARVVAAVHVGRKGLVAGVVAAAVERMSAAGGDPRSVVAAVGPAIGSCCYEVGDDVFEEVVSAVPAAAAQSTCGMPSLDLGAGVAAQLGALGVGPAKRAGGCTRCHEAEWFSYRRDGVTGRHAGLVWLTASGTA